jgi:hypothetical protein
MNKVPATLVPTGAVGAMCTLIVAVVPGSTASGAIDAPAPASVQFSTASPIDEVTAVSKPRVTTDAVVVSEPVGSPPGGYGPISACTSAQSPDETPVGGAWVTEEAVGPAKRRCVMQR